MATSSQRGYDKGDIAARAAGVALGAGLALAPRAVPFVKQRWYLVVPAFFWAPVPLFLFVGILFGGGDILALAFKAAFVAGLVTWACVFVRKQMGTVPRPVVPADPFEALHRGWPEVARHARLFGVPTPDGRVVPALARQLGYLPPVAEQAPSLVQVEATLLGPALTVRMHPGQVLKDYQRAAEVISNLWQVPTVRVAQPTGTDTVVITLVTSDPLAQTYEVTPDTIPAMSSLRSVEVGRQEDGQPWLFPLAECHSIVGGVPGAGKSVFANVVLAGVAQRPDVQIVGIDCAGGVELSDWSPRLSALATNQDEALEALQALWREHELRIEWLKANGYKSLTNAGFSEEMPLYICLIDEAAQLFRLESMNKAEKEKGNALVDLVTRLITVSRKTGIVVVLATQKPQSSTIPTLARDNAQVKVCFRVMTPEAAKTVLGDTLSLAPVPPTAIRREQKGVAVAEGADGELTLVRSYYISEDSDRAIASRFAHLTRQLTEKE